MPRYVVFADYREKPSEGIQIVSKTLIDGLRAAGHDVAIIPPHLIKRRVLRLIAQRPDKIIFTHGPGKGSVFLSAALRRLTRARIIWVATRPDVGDVPRWLHGRATAHEVICNRRRSDLRSVTKCARFTYQFIGIDPARVTSAANAARIRWPEIAGSSSPVALHVGHLRHNRGLDLLAEAKRRFGDRLDIVVQGSPTFPADPDVVEELESAGVQVRRDFIDDIGSLYRSADLYLFPVRGADAGAIELPLSVLEAVASRVPVLCTDYGALPDALRGVEGVTITSRDTFLGTLGNLLADPHRLQKRPNGLPDHLSAERVTEAVLRMSSTRP